MPGGSPGTPLSTLGPTENIHYFCLKVVTYTSIIMIMLPLISLILLLCSSELKLPPNINYCGMSAVSFLGQSGNKAIHVGQHGGK